MYSENMYGHAFLCCSKIGARSLLNLHRYYGSWKSAWKSNNESLYSSGIPHKIIKDLVVHRSQFNFKKQEELLQKSQISLLSCFDDNFPPLLKETPDSPTLLYTRGNVDLLKQISITIVGSRKCTDYGKRVVSQIVPELVYANVSIASGLALGIDAEAHRETLTSQGKTIAVLASGLDDSMIFPRTNFNLAKDILKKDGVLISEYPPLFPPLHQQFPMRNRILAGISKATIVVEAAKRSGALITAYLSLDYNREVFAVPGTVFSPFSEGSHSLIKKGAHLLQSGQDILDALQLNSTTSSKVVITYTNDELRVLKLLSSEPLSFDKIVEHSTLLSSKALSILINLELKGSVAQPTPQYYIKVHL